jgi:hypothetical protein
VGGKQKIKKAETSSLSHSGFYILRAPNQLHLLLATLELASTLSRRFRKVLASRFTCGATIFPHFLVVRHLLRGRRGPVASFNYKSLQLQAPIINGTSTRVTNIGNVGSLDDRICVLGLQQAVRSTVKPFIGMDSKHSLTSWRSDKNVLVASSHILGVFQMVFRHSMAEEAAARVNEL